MRIALVRHWHSLERDGGKFGVGADGAQGYELFYAVPAGLFYQLYAHHEVGRLAA